MKFTNHLFITLLLSGTLLSCSHKESPKRKSPSNMELSTKEIVFPPSEALNLDAYYLSASCRTDTTTWLVGYNYRMHALDIINLNTKEISQTMLEKEGPSSLARPISIYLHNPDSIWICDQTYQAALINREGLIVQKWALAESLDSSEKVIINTNYAMNTSKLYFNKSRGSLFYTIQKTEGGESSFYVREYSLKHSTETKRYPLASPVTKKEADTNFGYMDGINVTFLDDRILYNYPIESSFYVYNLLTGENKLIETPSAYTQNSVKPLSNTQDYSEWEKHGLENPHFYEIMYLPQYDIYARLHLKETDLDKTKSMDDLSNNRELYLMCWDKDFKPLCEIKLPEHRYNYYTGWCPTYDGLLICVNNEASPEELSVDIISPKNFIHK